MDFRSDCGWFVFRPSDSIENGLPQAPTQHIEVINNVLAKSLEILGFLLLLLLLKSPLFTVFVSPLLLWHCGTVMWKVT